MKTYQELAIKILYFIATDVLTASDENVGESNKNDNDIGWGGNWR